MLFDCFSCLGFVWANSRFVGGSKIVCLVSGRFGIRCFFFVLICVFLFCLWCVVLGGFWIILFE